jgi:hypothetical protein
MNEGQFTLPLRHGLAAVLIEGEGDRPPMVAPKARAPRRWAKNSHLWQDCSCFECAGRRAGIVDDGYERPETP